MPVSRRSPIQRDARHDRLRRHEPVLRLARPRPSKTPRPSGATPSCWRTTGLVTAGQSRRHEARRVRPGFQLRWSGLPGRGAHGGGAPHQPRPRTHRAGYGKRAGRELLARADRPTAVFVSSDQQAVGLLCTLHEAGLRVPKDLAVFAFDGSPESEDTWARLSTVAQPVKDLAQTALEALLAPGPEGKRRLKFSPPSWYCAHPAAATDACTAFPAALKGGHRWGKTSSVLVAVARSSPPAVLRRPSVNITREPVFTTDPSARRAPF